MRRRFYLFCSQHHLCIDRVKYEHAFCELDQGGPVILQGGEDDKKPAMKLSQAMMIKKYQRIIAANSMTRKVRFLWGKFSGVVKKYRVVENVIIVCLKFCIGSST